MVISLPLNILVLIQLLCYTYFKIFFKWQPQSHQKSSEFSLSLFLPTHRPGGAHMLCTWDPMMIRQCLTRHANWLALRELEPLHVGDAIWLVATVAGAPGPWDIREVWSPCYLVRKPQKCKWDSKHPPAFGEVLAGIISYVRTVPQPGWGASTTLHPLGFQGPAVVRRRVTRNILVSQSWGLSKEQEDFTSWWAFVDSAGRPATHAGLGPEWSSGLRTCRW